MNNRVISEIILGTIGTGFIVRSILDAVAQTKGIRCEAVYSRSEIKGRALADAYNIKTVYIDIDALMNDTQINFIYIASPNDLHYSQAKIALENGKNVLCEKPLTPEKDQAEELIRLAEAKGLLLIEAVPTPYLPNFKILKDNLVNVGRVRLVLCNYSQYSSRYDKLLAGELPNVFSLSHAGGCLQDINFYNIYLNVSLFGKPIDAFYFPNIEPGQADTSGIMIMVYDGFVSSCAGAKDTWGDNHVLIEGENGYIRIKEGSNGLTDIQLTTRSSEYKINNQPCSDRWFYEIQEITRLVLSGEYDVIAQNLATTLEVIKAMENARTKAGIYFE